MALYRNRSIAIDVAQTILAVCVVGLTSVASMKLNSTAGRLPVAFWLSLIVSVIIYPIVFGIELMMPPVGPRKSLHTWLFNYRLNMMLAVAFGAAGAISGRFLTLLSRHFHLGLIDLRIGVDHALWRMVSAFLLSVLVYDFFYYWYHRSLHAFPLLWQIHKLHHMDVQMDAVTVGRQNWVEGFTHTFVAIFLPSLIFRFDQVNFFQEGLASALIGVLFFCWGPFFHANVRLDLGRAAVILQGPQLHRIHHSRLPQHQDKNFANYFPIWDLVFGTYYQPVRGEYPPTGVVGEPEIETVVDAELLTIREWIRMWKKQPFQEQVQ